MVAHTLGVSMALFLGRRFPPVLPLSRLSLGAGTTGGVVFSASGPESRSLFFDRSLPFRFFPILFSLNIEGSLVPSPTLQL